MGLIIMDYFNNLFSKSNGDYLGVTELIESVVSDSGNDRLLAPFSAKEYCRAIFQMHPNKMPGLDVINLAFYKKF